MNSKQKQNKKQQLEEIYGSCCFWCGKSLALSELTIEHMIPRSMGGGNNLENLRLACCPCNRSRGNKPFPQSYSASWEHFDQLAPLRINNIIKAHDSAIATTPKFSKAFSATTGVDASIARQ